MEPDFWLERWARGETGFHLPHVNPHLIEYWPALHLRRDARVLVPLAGKSVDLLWLRDRGHEVVAVDISRLAALAVFAAAGLEPEIAQLDEFEIFRAPGVSFLVGDFFAATPALIGPVEAVYDRAALIALPAPLRERYAERISDLQSPQARTLLVGFEYPQQEMNGPPFAVTQLEVESLFGGTHEIEVLGATDILPDEPKFRARGVSSLVERVYLMRRRP